MLSLTPSNTITKHVPQPSLLSNIIALDLEHIAYVYCTNQLIIHNISKTTDHIEAIVKYPPVRGGIRKGDAVLIYSARNKIIYTLIKSAWTVFTYHLNSSSSPHHHQELLNSGDFFYFSFIKKSWPDEVNKCKKFCENSLNNILLIKDKLYFIYAEYDDYHVNLRPRSPSNYATLVFVFDEKENELKLLRFLYVKYCPSIKYKAVVSANNKAIFIINTHTLERAEVDLHGDDYNGKKKPLTFIKLEIDTDYFDFDKFDPLHSSPQEKKYSFDYKQIVYCKHNRILGLQTEENRFLFVDIIDILNSSITRIRLWPYLDPNDWELISYLDISNQSLIVNGFCRDFLKTKVLVDLITLYFESEIIAFVDKGRPHWHCIKSYNVRIDGILKEERFNVAISLEKNLTETKQQMVKQIFKSMF